jgi:hypothetical protein
MFWNAGGADHGDSAVTRQLDHRGADAAGKMDVGRLSFASLVFSCGFAFAAVSMNALVRNWAESCAVRRCHCTRGWGRTTYSPEASAVRSRLHSLALQGAAKSKARAQILV